jgi:hypothetical protein
VPRRSMFLGTLAAMMLIGIHSAHAQRGNRSGLAMTPYGPVYNPMLSPDYRLYAANPALYEQVVTARQMQAANKQQQQMLKQQRVFAKWLKDQKSKKDKGKPTDPAYDQLMKMKEAQANAAFKATAKSSSRKSGSTKSRSTGSSTSTKDSATTASKSADPN